MDYSEAAAFARQTLEYATAHELTQFCLDEMRHRFADLPIWFNGEV